MRTSILNLIRKSGIISFNDIIYALNLQTEYNEAAKQIAYLQMEGFVHYVPGKGYEAK
ncbi:FaeA-like protein [Bacteroides phage EMB1]|nr:FaeA-like protein [Bacteroides phage EMB1]